MQSKTLGIIGGLGPMATARFLELTVRMTEASRNQDHLAQDRGLTRKLDLAAPWELFLLNEPPGRCTVVTVCSNGALSSRLCLGLDENTLLLYKLYTGKILWKENHILARYLETYRRQFAGRNTFVPKTLYELRSMLQVLGGTYGN